jgi:hypothetical protein
MIKFCERMGWSMLAVVLEHMSDRLTAGSFYYTYLERSFVRLIVCMYTGARSDLLELSMVAFIKSRTARIFWENGLKSVKAVAHAEPKDVIPILKLVSSLMLVLHGTSNW